jgi:hypothetical protein
MKHTKWPIFTSLANESRPQWRTCHWGNAATRLFLLECEALFKNAWHLNDIFSKFKAFLKISIYFEDIFKGSEGFLINVRNLQRLRGFLNTF